MPDDDAEPGGPPVLRYIADSKAEDNRLAAAQNAADQLGLRLGRVARSLAQITEPELTADELIDALGRAAGLPPWPSPGALSGSAVTVSAASGDFAQAWDEIKGRRFPDIKLISKFPKNRAEISANQIILVSVLLVAAIYPVLPPDVQRLLTTEAGLMSAIAAILALLKSERRK